MIASPPATTDRRALSLAVLTMATWGMAGSFVRLLATRLPQTAPLTAFAVLGGRLLVALAALTLVLALAQTRALRTEILPALRRRETWMFAALQFAYYLFAVVAFTFAPIAEIALCAATPPLWVLLLRKLRGGTVSRSEATGAAFAVAGALLIVAPNLLKSHAAADAFPLRALGDGLSLLSALASALYALLQRRAVRENVAVDARAVSLGTFALGAPLALLLRPVPPSVLFNGAPLALFATFAVVTTVVPTLAFAFAARRLPPVTTATVALLLPVFATAYAAIALHETPPWTLIPGGVLVIMGLWQILRPTAV